MKESVGGVFLFQIVIFFILLFTGIMCLTINHSKAFAVKDDVIQYIENNGGILVDVEQLDENIVDILTHDNYYTTGNCTWGETDDSYTDFGYNNGVLEKAFQRDGRIDSSGENAAICIRVISIDKNDYLSSDLGLEAGKDYLEEDTARGCYYEIKVFYNLSIPVMGSFFNFNVTGQTKVLYASPNRTDYCAANVGKSSFN